MRNLPQIAIDALEKDVVMLVALVKFDLLNPVCATTHYAQIAWNGTVYSAETGLVDVPDITQEFDLSSSTLTLDFLDADGFLTGHAQNYGYIDKQMEIHVGILSVADLSVLHVIPSVYRGYCDELKPGDARVSFVFKNETHRFDRTAGRRTNNASQHRFYLDDMVFDDITNMSGDIL